jgi:hypothetical protein
MDEQEVKEILEHKERRDRFAMVALLGAILNNANAPNEDRVFLEISQSAYQMADAMIKARDA